MRRRADLRPALTRVESAAIAVVTVLLLGLVPSCIQKTRVTSNRGRCQNNIKQLALAVHNYASTYKDQLPPAYARRSTGETTVGGSVIFWLLPYIEQDAIFREACANGGGNWKSTEGPQFKPMKALMCPSDVTNSSGVTGIGGHARTSYAANYFLFGYGPPVKPYDEKFSRLPLYTIADIPDGTSNTVMWSEHSAISVNGGIRLTMMYGPDNGGLPPDCVLPLFNYQDHAASQPKWDGIGEFDGVGTKFWMPQFNPTAVSSPNPATYNMVQGYHADVVVVSTADGSVRGINPRVSKLTWARAIYPCDGQSPGADW